MSTGVVIGLSVFCVFVGIAVLAAIIAVIATVSGFGKAEENDED